MTRKNNATLDPDTGKERVYGGDTGLIHVADGSRQQLGADMALMLSNRMRVDAMASGARTEQQAIEQNLCPGCYMVVVLNMAIELAKRNGQSLSELGNSLGAAFLQLADGGLKDLEHITVQLDPEPINDRDFAITMAAMLGPWSLGGGMP